MARSQDLVFTLYGDYLRHRGGEAEKGIKFGSIQVIDSVHTVADVNVEKDEKRQKCSKPPRDDKCSLGGVLTGSRGKGHKGGNG